MNATKKALFLNLILSLVSVACASAAEKLSQIEEERKERAPLEVAGIILSIRESQPFYSVVKNPADKSATTTSANIKLANNYELNIGISQKKNRINATVTTVQAGLVPSRRQYEGDLAKELYDTLIVYGKRQD